MGDIDVRIAFDSIDWHDDVPGIRARATAVEGRRWALVEYAPAARRREWCLDGHAGLVLKGSIEYEFDDGTSPLRLHEGDAFQLATNRPHRGTNRSEGETRLFLIDDPADAA